MTSKKERQRDDVSRSEKSEFFLRTVSALALGVFALALTWSGPGPFAMLAAACFAVLAWEWAGMRGRKATGAPVFMQGIALSIAVAFALAGQWLYAVLTVVAMALFLLLPVVESPKEQSRLSALGMLYFGIPVLALIFLRGDAEYGFAVILFVFLAVWGADTAAYVFGKLIGGAKLAPSISPGKTWSGFLAGISVPTLAGLGISLWLGNGAHVPLTLIAAGLALASQIGDLCESVAKRKFGVKDSSSLIPGHGGLFDRVDGLLFAAVAAAAIACLRDPAAPGSALLIWR